MQASKHRNAGLIILTLAYPLTHFIVHYIPNPIIPTANIALNMIFPILAGYFYGPVSGALAGALGTGLSAIVGADIYDAMSILAHTLMGVAAGMTGKSRSQFRTGLTIIIGHALNILFFWRFDLLVIKDVGTLVLALVTETTVDMVAIILMIVLLQKWLYRGAEQRW
jgi:uncharacterized membrane protein